MTAATIAPGKRAATYNPTLRRHSWTKEREHHRRCNFCGLHVENSPGGGGYFQLWDWPAELNLAPGTNQRDKAPVPNCPGPPGAAVVVAMNAQPAPLVEVPGAATFPCKACGDPLIAFVPTRDGLPVAIEDRDPAGDLVAVKVGDAWTVRPHTPGDGVDVSLRRRSHWCIYKYRCNGKAGKCTSRARLYAVGTFCDDCVPRGR